MTGKEVRAMRLLVVTVIAVLGAIALLRATASAAETHASEFGTAYVDIRGELRFEFDRARKQFQLYGIPSDVSANGTTPIERLSGSYMDCSDVVIVCFDFAEFALAVPKDLRQTRWSKGQWNFRRTACLPSGSGPTCDRFSAVFENKADKAEGGFVFSRSNGVELFFHSKGSAKPIDALYILQRGKGLLADGHP
jgi:hypothetical protein